MAIDTKKYKFSENIKGVSIEEGLQRLGGNEDLYLELLCDFVKDYSQFSDIVKSALEDGDKETASRLVHTVKGITGSLGMNGLHEDLIKLETAIKTNQNIKQYSDIVNFNLEEVLLSLQEIVLPKQKVPLPTSTSSLAVPYEVVSPLIKELRELLEISDMSSDDIFNKLKNYFNSFSVESTCDLESCLTGFDFEGALVALDELDALAQNVT
ncbi:MAG: Hpt domain-containing protein [Desulfotalea sp.]